MFGAGGGGLLAAIHKQDTAQVGNLFSLFCISPRTNFGCRDQAKVESFFRLL